jgi:hypothetical protein
MRLPNFLIVGAAKSGTTSLYHYLSQHPDIGFPTLKEPKFFSSKNLEFPHNGIGDQAIDKYAIKDINEYRKLFKNIQHKKMIGEASPDYLLFYKNTPSEIKNILGDIPIIIILRNPVDRAFSAYSNLVRDSRETRTFREGLDKEEERKNSNYDFMWQYKESGLYYAQVKAYKNNFKNVKVILLDDLKNNRRETIEELFLFLNVDVNIKVDVNTKYNPSGKPINFLAKFLLSRDNDFSVILREILKKIIPRKVLESTSRAFLKKDDMTPGDRSYLKDYFRNDLNKLDELINRNLNEWKK